MLNYEYLSVRCLHILQAVRRMDVVRGRQCPHSVRNDYLLIQGAAVVHKSQQGDARSERRCTLTSFAAAYLSNTKMKKLVCLYCRKHAFVFNAFMPHKHANVQYIL